MMTLGPIFSALGLAVLGYRLGPAAVQAWRDADSDGEGLTVVAGDDLVSIIIPARNEEQNLPTLLVSLRHLEWKKIEIIVVDDNSTDRTVDVVEAARISDSRIQLIRAGIKPEGWVGKTWACEQGAKAATGLWLLFTDADTEHRPGSLSQALQLARTQNLDLLSAIPFHESGTWFDELIGPFQMLVLICSSAFSKPAKNRLFAIGQYLLFKRDFYFQQGRHEAVKMSFGEDMDMAERCLELGGRYDLDRSGQIFGVRMYSSLQDFVEGWRRIFRIGFARAELAAACEIFFVIACLTMSFHFSKASALETLLAILGLIIVGLAQKRYGRFSWFGIFTIPFSLGLFVFVTALALFDRMARRELRWRGRSYKLRV